MLQSWFISLCGDFIHSCEQRVRCLLPVSYQQKKQSTGFRPQRQHDISLSIEAPLCFVLKVPLKEKSTQRQRGYRGDMIFFAFRFFLILIDLLKLLQINFQSN